MRKKGLVFTFILLVILSFFATLLHLSGKLAKTPVIETFPDNCYTDTLFVMTDQDYRPYSFFDEDGNYSGHDVELITILANRMHMNLDLKLLPWNETINDVISGKAQVLMTCDYSDTFYGTDQLIKSDALSTDDFTVFSKSRITSVHELYGKRIGVMNNGNVMKYIEMLNLMQYCIKYDDNRQALLALENGEVDYAIMRHTVGSVLMRELEIKDITGYCTIGQSYMCFGINSDYPDIVSKINEALEQIKISGDLKRLNDKWLTTFVAPYSFSETVTNNFGMVIGFFVFMLVIAFLFYRNEGRKRVTIVEKDQYVRIVKNLTNDFECVNYIPLSQDKFKASATLIRISDTLARNIPEWAVEVNVSKRLSILCNSIVAPEDRDNFMRETRREVVLEKVMKGDTYFVNFKAYIDGGLHYFQSKFSPVYDADKNVIGLVFGLHNVDAQTKAELYAKEKLQLANKSKTDFLFNMSHDIRTPMNAIIGFTRLAQKNMDDKSRVSDYLKKIETSGNHLLDLINEVLDMSRVEAGKLKSELKTVNIREQAKKLMTICQETADDRGITLSVNDSDLTNLIVVADDLHINQVLMNILGNAIKYTMPGGHVSLTVSELQSEIPQYGKYRFVVKDNGIGMSQPFLSKIFDSFSREDNEAVRAVQGTGLGMSIVKRLVDYMDGKIEIESKQGRGTKVTVTLHLKLSAATDVVKENKPAPTANLTGKKVLLVEDNELNREIATAILLEFGVEVESAPNGCEAVDMVLGKGIHYYDCILMDIQMPLMDGFEATSEIRKIPDADTLVIIALSANAFDEDRQRSIAAGMNDHLAKPINPELLKETLCRYL